MMLHVLRLKRQRGSLGEDDLLLLQELPRSAVGWTTRTFWRMENAES